MRREEEDLARLLKKSLPSAQQEQETGKRVFYRLLLARTESSTAALPNDDESGPDRKRRPRLLIAVAATAGLASFLFVLFLTSGLWRTRESLAHTEPAGDPIRSGESVWVSNPEGMRLVLRDGSRVEMRSQSNLQIDHADDGLRVRLNAGSVIVTAAKQGVGHLYVETKGAIVSVVGTVFLVSAEKTGSRVGVIEGVVNVQQGAISQKLLPGQQLATNPAMEPVPLNVQVSWSRSVASHLALLQQSLPPAQPTSAAALAFPPQSRPPAAPQNTQTPDTLLIIGTANNGAAARVGQRQAFGNGRPDPVDDPTRAPAPTPETERAMEQALLSREPITDLLFVSETNYFQINMAEYFVPVTLKIAGAQLARSESAKRIFFDILGEVTDGYGSPVGNFREAVDVRLSDERAKELSLRQIAFDTGFTLLPGRYSMKFLIHDRDTGRIGTYKTDVVIPNLAREGKNLPISSVVLSSELINLDDALSNSMNPRSFSADSQLAVDPLIIEGKKLIPSGTGPFSNRRDLIVFLHAYEPNATATEPLTAFVTLYRGQTKVFETPPLIVKDDLGRKLRILPVKLRVPLTSLPVGAYECEVTVLDPATQKSAVWRSPITVVN
jgi:ferric-dicitrate binding protein FerR (iron transport regulator)